MHGAPALPPDFTHLPYADPEAPSGGALILGEQGGFDSFNPYLVKGSAPWAVRAHVVESLMARSMDEPFTVYGLIAKTIETPEDRSWVAFELRPEARFSSGEPVTVEDVIWSLETLRQKGRPNFRDYYKRVASIERQGEHGVKFVFAEPERELPLLLGLMPILSKKAWEGRDFGDAALEPMIGSGPYVIESFEAGRFVKLRKNPDYWAADLPLNAGRNNFDAIEYQYFQDASALWEAFKAGEISYYQDADPAHWADAYDFPAAQDGRIVQSEFAHHRASGMQGFVFNTRRPQFEDRRVRRALALAFDFAWVNERFYRSGFERITSYFSGSSLGFDGGAEGLERELLTPFAEELPAGTLEEGWRPPEGAGDGRNRRNLRKARKLLEEAGWSVRDGALRDAEGRPFRFEILLNATANERLAAVWSEALETLGVEATPRLVDQAQYQKLLTDYDYDVMVNIWWLSLSPGQEQRFYWGSAGRDLAGTRNYMGVASPAVDAMIDALLEERERSDFEAATRALDRALSSGVYVVPFGYLKTDRVAHLGEIRAPERRSLYGFQPDVLWSAAE